MVAFMLFACGPTILNSRSVSSSAKEVSKGMTSCEAHVLSSAERQDAIGGP
jgi:hypothetical protein